MLDVLAARIVVWALLIGAFVVAAYRTGMGDTWAPYGMAALFAAIVILAVAQARRGRPRV